MFKINKNHNSEQVTSEVDSAMGLVDDKNKLQNQENNQLSNSSGLNQPKNNPNNSFGKKQKTIIGLILVIILAIVIALGLYIFNAKNSNIAISVNDNSITKSQYLAYKSEYDKLKKPELDKDFSKYITENLVYSSAAKQYNISASEEDINAKIVDIFGTRQEQITDWMKFVATGAVYKQHLEDTNVKDLYAHFVFPFSRHFANGYSEEPIKDLGNQAKIDEDKKYAQEKANEYFQLVKTDNSVDNANKLVEKIKLDSRLNYGFSGNNSEVFGYLANGAKSGSLSNNRYPSDKELEITKNLKSNTEILVETNTGVSSLPGYNNGDVPIAYYFYTKPTTTKINPFNYNDYYKTAKIKINVKN